MATVALATGDSQYKTTFKAVEMLGGMDKFVKKGDKVFIKPNLMLFTGPPTTTSPIVLGALVKMCKKAGAKEIAVGDISIVGTSSKAQMEFSGIKDYVSRLGDEKCKVTPFFIEDKLTDEQELAQYFKLVKNPKAKELPELYVPKVLMEADVFIDVPVAKTHDYTDVTLGLKNMHGMFHNSQKRASHGPEKSFSQKIIDMLTIDDAYPNLVVTDAWYAGEGEGPYFMTFRPLRLIAASEDVVANDAIVSYIMGFDPMKINMIRMAHEQGLGTADMKNIKVTGEDPEKYRIPDLKHPNLDYNYTYSPKIKAFIGHVYGDEGRHGCVMALRYIQMGALWFFPSMELALLVGKNPPDPGDIRTPDGRPMPIVVWGKCACETTKDYPFRKRGTGVAGGWAEINECPVLRLAMGEEFQGVALDKKGSSKRIVRRFLKPDILSILEFLQGNPSYLMGIIKPILTAEAEDL